MQLEMTAERLIGTETEFKFVLVVIVAFLQQVPGKQTKVSLTAERCSSTAM